MIKPFSLLLKNLIAVLLVVIVAAFTHRYDIAIGVVCGVAVGIINFLFLQVNVKTLVLAASATQPSEDKNFLLKAVLKYLARFVLKLFVLAGLLFLFIAVLKIQWPGLLLGLIISMVVYITEVSRLKRKV